MTTNLYELAWPRSRLGEAIATLATRAGLAARSADVGAPAGRLLELHASEGLDSWIEAAAGALGVEAEAVDAAHAEVEHLLREAGPLLLRVSRDYAPTQRARGASGGAGWDEPRFLLILRGAGKRLEVLPPDEPLRVVEASVVRECLCGRTESSVGADVEHVLTLAGISRRHRAKARASIVRDRLRGTRVGGCWLLRQDPGASAFAQLRGAGLGRWLAVVVATHTVQYVLFLASWWVIGRATLEGRVDMGALAAFGLLLLSGVPLRSITSYAQGVIGLVAGTLFRRRLMHGALRLDPDEVRHQGSGQLLGRVMESQAVESLAMGIGFAGLLAGIELVMAAGVLAAGAGGAAQALLLGGWTLLATAGAVTLVVRLRPTIEARRDMTNELVEQMVGHRTRLAQERPERWHAGEDRALERYLVVSAAFDRTATALSVLIPGGWLVASLAVLAAAFVRESGQSTGSIAVSLGGILLGAGAISRLVSALSSVGQLKIAWEQVGPLYWAAARPEVTGSPVFAVPAPVDEPDDPAGPAAVSAGAADSSGSGAFPAPAVIDARDLVFRYRDRGDPILRNLSVRIGRGERVLLEGPSGGGKSTLAAVLAGLRQPESGLVLLGGLDRQTIGAEGWRRRVVFAPQFHDNHVLAGTLAFNLLMGRRWPPEPDDLNRAEAVCGELGLDDLIARMPAGLHQMVGDSGWQLSHGERSRLFIARALLQEAEVVVLDESFGSLDPESLRLALRCVLARAQALVVIAHP